MTTKNTITRADLTATDAPEAPLYSDDVMPGNLPSEAVHKFKRSRTLSKEASHALCSDCGLSEQAQTHMRAKPAQPQQDKGNAKREHHTMDCLSKGDASVCPICKPINDAHGLRLELNPKKLADGVYILESFKIEKT